MKNQNRIVCLIGFIVIITIAIQFYWNYQLFKNNRQQVINEVQIALDNAVDTYYTQLSKESVIAYVFDNDTINEGKKYNALISPPVSSSVNSMRGDNSDIGKQLGKLGGLVDRVQESTLGAILQSDSSNGFSEKDNVKIIQSNRQIDSLNNNLTDALIKVITSIQFDSINFSTLKGLIDEELDKKNIHFDYSLFQKDLLGDSIYSSGVSDSIKYPFVAVSHSSMLPMESSLELHYPDIFWLTLKKGFIGILLSSILSGAIIFSLFYLLHIIKKQKQLSEIKNDFISNITHELKTPIATVTSAVEGMRNFNTENDVEKNRKYLDISAKQLEKLKVLVEKIMETSVLESKDLVLEKEQSDLILLIKNTIEKHKLNTQKSIDFESNTSKFIYDVDAFHFENALSNIVENAIKYGGNEINIRLFETDRQIVISISDNGNGISKEHQKMIFDKFYRVPNKNKHTVKGFGIGLYYTKNIIEKHNGTIELKSEKNRTAFKITLWTK